MHKKVKSGNPTRNLDIYLALKSTNYRFSARNQFYFACEYYYNGLYSDAILEFEKFLSLKDGYYENKIQTCLNLMRIYIIRQEYDKAIEYGLYSFKFDTPRPEILCELGNIYMLYRDYHKAIYWYSLAIQKIKVGGGFYEIDKYGYVPCVQIGICYYYMQDYKKAYKYNHKALKYKPLSQIAINNETLYLNLLNKSLY